MSDWHIHRPKSQWATHGPLVNLIVGCQQWTTVYQLVMPPENHLWWHPTVGHWWTTSQPCRLLKVGHWWANRKAYHWLPTVGHWRSIRKPYCRLPTVDHCLSAGHANGWPPPAANVGPTAMPPVGQRWPYRVLLSGIQYIPDFRLGYNYFMNVKLPFKGHDKHYMLLWFKFIFLNFLFILFYFSINDISVPLGFHGTTSWIIWFLEKNAFDPQQIR